MEQDNKKAIADDKILKKEIENLPKVLDKKQEKYIKNFTNNLLEGINYYTSIFKNSSDFINSKKELLIAELNFAKINLEKVQQKIERKAGVKHSIEHGYDYDKVQKNLPADPTIPYEDRVEMASEFMDDGMDR